MTVETGDSFELTDTERKALIIEVTKDRYALEFAGLALASGHKRKLSDTELFDAATIAYRRSLEAPVVE